MRVRHGSPNLFPGNGVAPGPNLAPGQGLPFLALAESMIPREVMEVIRPAGGRTLLLL